MIFSGVAVDAINITAYHLQNTALVCTINHIKNKRKDNQPTNQQFSEPRFQIEKISRDSLA